MSATQAQSRNIMNGMSRFLSRRDKRSSRHEPTKDRKIGSKPLTNVYDIFANGSPKKSDKEEERKVKALLEKLQDLGIKTLKESQVEYALQSDYSNGDAGKALELLVLFEDSIEGILKEHDSSVHMLGAQNRGMVTCYLDALLFAMFARLDTFEGMLFNHFEDEARKRLATLLRLWVNMLRTGKLITVDIVGHIQEALATCGWEDAKEERQQDTSEAFTFITDKLELPLLTLKMDIYHTGKEDKQDDHKFVNERLLEVALPDPPADGENSVTLEECLESYFNNKIEVKRHLQRRNTVQSVKGLDTGKDETVRIETVDLGTGSLDSPMTPMTPTSAVATPISPERPGLTERRRAESIFSHRVIEREKPKNDNGKEDTVLPPLRRPRGQSIRKEVMMPAWQFFSLIPWYTDNAPKSDAQVAAHFSAKRPILGICLKRYTMLMNGTPKRLDTFVDIPLEIALPHFVSDDKMEEEGPLFGNFKLSLQSVVCHRGVRVDSGHYIALVREDRDESVPHSSAAPPAYKQPKWLLFDDMKEQRVVEVDITEALKRESPYLLFFRVEPINEELAMGEPPTYDEASTGQLTAEPSTEDLSHAARGDEPKAPFAQDLAAKNVPLIATTSPASPTIGNPLDNVDERSGKLRTTTSDPSTGAASIDISSLNAPSQTPAPVSRSSMSSTRNSIAFEDTSTTASNSVRAHTAPTTPGEEGKSNFTSSSRRNSKVEKIRSKSRPESQSGESRLSATVGLLTGRKSRDRLADRDEFALEGADDMADKTESNSKFGSLGRSKSKKDRKDKRSRSVGARPFLDNSNKSDRPDRECNVM